MNTFKYDYSIVGRWRNHDKINECKQALRDAGKTVYCFTDNEYDGDGIKFETHAAADTHGMMAQFEATEDWQTNPTIRKIFETLYLMLDQIFPDVKTLAEQLT